MSSRKVFILGGYQPYAASHLIYHVGRVLDQRFGFEPVVVRLGDDESPENSPFTYERKFGSIGIGELHRSLGRDDLFLPLAAAWEHPFGLTLPCTKILYVQGVNTFKVLDGFMDGYVSVSGFVQESLKRQYAIESPVIHPFLDFERLPPPLAWLDRGPDTVVVFVKPPQIANALLSAFLERFAHRHPDLRPNFVVVQRGMPHGELMSLLSRTRMVVSLSPIEGFGLVPLEAMACGCAFTGFHGGGGLDYMTADNSRCVGYPRLDQLVELFAATYRDSAMAQALASRAQSDARQFTRERFDDAWTRYVTELGV